MGVRVVKVQKKNTRKRDPEIIKRDAKEKNRRTHGYENRKMLGRLWGLGG